MNQPPPGRPGPTRVYLPVTLSTLATGFVAGGFEPGHAAHAVTPAIREWYIEGDLEELEYAAMTEAVEASLRLLAAEQAAHPSVPSDGDGEPLPERYRYRRVVVAADVDPGSVGPAGGAQDTGATPARSAVRLLAAVPLRSVVSVHVDDGDATGAVRDAMDALVAADLGDDDAQFLLDEAQSHELLWYDVTEIADLI